MSSNSQHTQNLFQDIAPAQAMQIAVDSFTGNRLELCAPLEPNLNDKGTGFAGSITSMLVLAGWGLITLHLREAGVQAEVVVSKSETQYRSPVRGELCSIAEVDGEQLKQLVADYSETSRGRLDVSIRLTSEGETCATMTACYVVKCS
jgi:thioesterase domain-containing protein